MKKVISFLSENLLNRTLTILLIGFLFLLVPAFSNSNGTQAYATSMVSSENYTEHSTRQPVRYRDDISLDDVQPQPDSQVNEIREKLNLDEPVPQSTKDFFNSLGEKIEKNTIDPLREKTQ